jgi:hypothetical protein
MSIEFRCHECGKLLRTEDGTVGRQAQCPECGAVSTVPDATAASEATASPFAPAAGDNPFGSPPPADAESGDNPYQSPVSPTYIPPGQVDAFAAQRVSGPATALIVTAILALISQAGLVTIGLTRMGVAPMMPRHHRNEMFRDDMVPMMMVGGGANVAGGLLRIAVAVVMLVGAMKMKKLESYSFAMASAIIAMVPCISPCCLLGLPFGIWALVVLNDGSVKAAFRS